MQQYNEKFLGFITLSSDKNCSALQPKETNQIYKTGCNLEGSSKSVTQACSGSITYSIIIISIISFLFHINYMLL